MYRGSDPLLLYVIQYWPGLTAVAGLALGGYAYLSSNGYIDGVIHRSEFTIFKTHVEERHIELKETVQEVRGDVKQMLQEQIKLGRAVERINSTPVIKP